MQTVEEQISKANERLKAGRVGLTIKLRGNRISLQGYFPPKPDSSKNSNHQQTLALGLYANPAGIKRAEAEAKKIAGAIACKEFLWEDWLDIKKKNELPAKDAIVQFKENYFQVRKLTPKSETTWNSNYHCILKRLPPELPITKERLLELILTTEPDSRIRQLTCLACNAIADFLDLDATFKEYQGKYSINCVEPRNLPSDELIEKTRNSIKNPAWQWVYGMIACYGLRNHEVFYVDLKSLTKEPGIINLLDGKTGARTIFPCYPEWWRRWKLWEIKMPNVSGRTNQELGQRVTRQFWGKKLGKAYNLRHAWAIRSMLFGMDVAMASAQMGHSVDLHTKLYHKWITETHQKKAFDILMARPNRPIAPLE